MDNSATGKKNSSEKKDEEIVRLIQSGRTGLFDILMERYEKKIVRYARKFLADNEEIMDVIQDIFLKVYENIQSFDTKKKFSTWLYRIAHNELVNVLKKKKKNLVSLSLFDPDIFFPHNLRDCSLDKSINHQDMRRMIDTCLNCLEPKYREPIVLYYFEDLSYQEIADIIQIPIATVGIRIKRAKEKMKPIYQELKKI